MKYYATIITDSDLVVSISTDYDNRLIDNYYVAKWEDEVSKLISLYINNEIEPGAKVRFIINAQNEELKAYKGNHSFVEFGDQFQDRVRLLVDLGTPKKIDAKQLQKCFKIVNWIKMQKYKTDIVFLFEDDLFIRVESKDLEKIKEWQNLKQYMI